MKKSNPIGVRLNLEKLEIIKKEQNLKSAQAVVNYFMDNYQSISTPKTLLDIIDVKDEPNILGIGSSVSYKKEMPKGLSIQERIDWLEENEKL
jgi:galactokinase/mevalonate kinase-like predicted kinase